MDLTNHLPIWLRVTRPNYSGYRLELVPPGTDPMKFGDPIFEVTAGDMAVLTFPTDTHDYEAWIERRRQEGFEFIRRR